MIADRLVSLGLLAAGLSHHIRNSLVAVKTFLDLAPAKLEEEKLDLEGLRNPDFWKEYYQNVQTQIEKINTLLKDLWSASETPSFLFADRVRAIVVGVTIEVCRPVSTRRIQVDNQIPFCPNSAWTNQNFNGCLTCCLGRSGQPRWAAASRSRRNRSTAARSRKSGADQRQRPGSAQEALRVCSIHLSCGPMPRPCSIHLMACFFIIYHHGGKIGVRAGKDRARSSIWLPLSPNAPCGGNQDCCKNPVERQGLGEADFFRVIVLRRLRTAFVLTRCRPGVP